MALDLVHHLHGEVQPPVVHIDQHAHQLERRIVQLFDLPDGLRELRKPLQRIVFAQQRHDDAVRRGQRVDGQQPERGRAVDGDDVVPVSYTQL